MTHVTCRATYQNGPPQTAAPRGLPGHVTVQQEVGLELGQQQQDVGERAHEGQRDEREAGAAQTPGHAHLCAQSSPVTPHSQLCTRQTSSTPKRAQTAQTATKTLESQPTSA